MILALKDIHRHYHSDGYKTHALDGVNLELEPGEQLMIVGPSGSGKSTLLNILGLLDRGYTGTYSIGDKVASGLSKREQAHMRNKIFGYIFQEYHLLEEESILRNVRVPLLYSGIPAGKHKQHIVEALEQVGLSDIMQKKVKYLSGGQRQRVAIARALVNKPMVVLADEPTGSLDAGNRDVVLDILYSYLDESKILVFVTHDLEENRRGQQRIVEIRGGKLEAHR